MILLQENLDVIWRSLVLFHLVMDMINKEGLDKADFPYKVLKDYQFKVYLESMNCLNNSFLERFVIQMPTGSGKTRTAMEFITEYLNTREEGSIVLWLAHSQELCEQSIECFKEIWIHVARKKLKLFRCWGTAKTLPFSCKESAFIVASFQKLYALLKKNPIQFEEIAPKIRLIIVDEAHKVLAPTYRKVTKKLISKKTSVVGLTATPGRGADNYEGNKELSEFFFNKIIEITSPPDQTVISMLRDKKILAKVNIDPIITGINYELTKEEKKSLELFFDFPQEMLNRIGSDDARNLEIVKRLEFECRKGKSILFFGCSVAHSKFICSMIMFLGYSAAHIDGATEKGSRNQLLNDFRNKKINVLCNYGVLSTGFDAPKTDVIFIARPTASLVLYSQMVGRGLRGPTIGGTEYCKLIDVKDNIVGYDNFDYVYNYFRDYWVDTE